MIRSALSKKTHQKQAMSLHSIYLKIFVNYLQVIMIMISFKLNWPDLVSDFLRYQKTAGSATGRVINMDCFL